MINPRRRYGIERGCILVNAIKWIRTYWHILLVIFMKQVIFYGDKLDGMNS